jgi:glycosyltransferase involved in cell wall biosynthesis
MATDIVIGTHNRVAMLRATMTCIRERTHTPYRLTVIDDASQDGSAEYVEDQGIRLYRRAAQMGMHQNMIDLLLASDSDPMISTDDDALCPRLDPDWLSRLLEAMDARPDLMMLGLNNPGDNKTGSRHPYEDDGVVVYSKHVSNHFLAMRRELLEATVGLFEGEGSRISPNKTQARYVHSIGGRVGYLRDVYTYHYCPGSIRKPGKLWTSIMVQPVDMDTLEPPARWRQYPIPKKVEDACEHGLPDPTISSGPEDQGDSI